MTLDDTDDEVVTDPVTSPPKEAPCAKIDRTNIMDDADRDKIESPPRSPDREKTDFEKQVTLDIPNGEDLRLDDTSSEKGHDRLDGGSEEASSLPRVSKLKSRRHFAFAWILCIQTIQWFIICASGLLSAVMNGALVYHDGAYISLSLTFALVFVAHLAYFSMAHDLEAYLGPQSGQGLAHERYSNIFKFCSLTSTLCGLTYTLTASFSQLIYNIISTSVMFGLLATFICTKAFNNFPNVRILLNASLVGSLLSVNVWGFSLCDQFNNSWRGTDPLSLVLSTVIGFLIAAGILVRSRTVALNRVQQKIISADYGCTTILSIYTSFINTVWIKLVGEDLFNQQ